MNKSPFIEQAKGALLYALRCVVLGTVMRRTKGSLYTRELSEIDALCKKSCL